MKDELDFALEDNKRKASSRPLKSNKVVDEYLNQIKCFEEDRVLLAKQSAKTAWKVSTGFGLLALMAICSVFIMMPLKEIVPYVIKVDNATGHTTVARSIDDAKSVSYGEELDKYWINKFIIARNGYEWETIQNSFNTVKLMANRSVFGSYNNYITGENSPAKIFGENKTIRIDIHTITFLPTTSNDYSLAQIRFTRKIENNVGGDTIEYKPTIWTATITFNYLSEIKTEDERIINPLEFLVTSYREDRDID